MKSAIAIAVSGLAIMASAQLSAIPSCALTCLTTGITKTGCDLTDFKCSCSNDAFVAESVACVNKACTGDDIQKALAATTTLCSGAGVDISDKVGGGSPAPSSAAPSAAPSSAAPSAAPSSAAPSSAAPSGSAKPPASSAAPTGSPKPSGNATVPSGTGAPAPTYTGAASKMAAAGSLMALGLAVAAAF